jgi:hypothetical protein
MGMAIALAAMGPDAQGVAEVKKVAEQVLPDSAYRNWQLNALEVSSQPGEIFFGPPGAVHQVSANASKKKPARILAMIFADRGATLTKPA